MAKYLTANRPGSYRMSQLVAEARGAGISTARSCVELAPNLLGLKVDDAEPHSNQDWAVVVAAHTPVVPQAETNVATIESLLVAAIHANTDFLALGAAPTVVQVTAQVRALTRQVNGLLRIRLGRFDAAD